MTDSFLGIFAGVKSSYFDSFWNNLILMFDPFDAFDAFVPLVLFELLLLFEAAELFVLLPELLLLEGTAGVVSFPLVSLDD